MAELKGKLLRCDRCEHMHFLKLLGTETLDGGYGDTIEHYEEKPDGWLHETQMGLLCPDCADIFRKFVTEFMDGKVAPAWKYTKAREVTED